MLYWTNSALCRKCSGPNKHYKTNKENRPFQFHRELLKMNVLIWCGKSRPESFVALPHAQWRSFICDLYKRILAAACAHRSPVAFTGQSASQRILQPWSSYALRFFVEFSQWYLLKNVSQKGLSLKNLCDKPDASLTQSVHILMANYHQVKKPSWTFDSTQTANSTLSS